MLLLVSVENLWQCSYELGEVYVAMGVPYTKEQYFLQLVGTLHGHNESTSIMGNERLESPNSPIWHVVLKTVTTNQCVRVLQKLAVLKKALPTPRVTKAGKNQPLASHFLISNRWKISSQQPTYPTVFSRERRWMAWTWTWSIGAGDGTPIGEATGNNLPLAQWVLLGGFFREELHRATATSCCSAGFSSTASSRCSM
jgi:hypothetical protein